MNQFSIRRLKRPGSIHNRTSKPCSAWSGPKSLSVTCFRTISQEIQIVFSTSIKPARTMIWLVHAGPVSLALTRCFDQVRMRICFQISVHLALVVKQRGKWSVRQCKWDRGPRLITCPTIWVGPWSQADYLSVDAVRNSDPMKIVFRPVMIFLPYRKRRDVPGLNVD